MKLRIVLADDHELLRDALAQYATRCARFEVVASVADAQSTVAACAGFEPDLLLLDIEMPGRDSLGALADVRSASPRTKVVILSAYARDSFVQQAIDCGASGYLLKPDPPNAIFGALERVISGVPAFSPQVLRSRAGHAAPHADPGSA